MSFSTTLTDIKPFNNPSPVVFKQLEALKKIWGPWDQGFPNNNYMNPDNKEPLDILMMYNGREVIIPANQIIAYLLNIRNETFLKYLVPWVYSNEVNWRTALREINLVTFSPVAEGAPFDTLTMRTGTWTDTTKKVKLGITIASGVYRDQIFGEDQFKFYMQGLAQSAQLTIMIKECFALTTLAYANACSDLDGSDYLDHSKILNLTGSLFGILAHDPQLFYNRIEEIRRVEIPDLNSVIVPEKVLLFLEQLKGQPQSVLQEYIFPDNEVGRTNEVKIGTVKGPTSLTTINGISAFELKSFVFNSNRKQVIQPLTTTVIVARIWPHDPYRKLNCNDLFNPCMLTRQIYCHDKTYGDERFIDYRTTLRNCFLFDPKTSEPSKFLRLYIDTLNKHILNTNERPYKWKLLEDLLKSSFDVGADDGYDNDTPIQGSYENKKTIEEQRGWRDNFVAATYNPHIGNKGSYVVPKRVGDMNKESLPNCNIQHVSDALVVYLKAHCGIDLDYEINLVRRYISLIDESPWTSAYLENLYIANLQRIKVRGPGDKSIDIIENYEKKEEREKIYGRKIAIDWPPNIYGGFDLPDVVPGVVYPSYPAGFASASGLRTIASHLHRGTTSLYSNIAIEADRIVRTWEKIAEYIQEYIGNSDIVDELHTRQWFSKCSSLDALFEHILPQKPPLFLGIYDINYIDSLIPTDFMGRDHYTYTRTALWIYFNNVQNNDIRRKAYQVFHNEIFFTSDHYTIIDALIADGKRIPEELLSKRFMVLFMLLTQESSLLLTELSNSTKYSKDSIYEFSEQILIKTILGNIDTTYASIYSAVATEPFRERINQAQNIITFLNQKKATDLKLIKFSDFPPNKGEVKTKEYYEARLKKYIKTKSADPLIVFTADNDFDTTLTNVQAAFKKITDAENLHKVKKTIFNINDGTKPGYKEIPVPKYYVRTPLTLSEQLIEFITNRVHGHKIDILPGDVRTNYNFPANEKTIDDNSDEMRELKKVLEKSKIKLTSPKFDFSHFPVSEAFLSRNLKYDTKSYKAKGGDDDDYSTTKESLFTKKTSHKKKKKDFGDSIYSVFSKIGESSMKLDAHQERDAPSHYEQLKTPISFKTGDTDTDSFRMEFPGPWNKNIEYYKKMSSNGSALLFLGIIFTPFTMDVFANVAKLGLCLLKIDIMRNAEEHDMSSCIVMTAGSGTAIMVFGRIAVIPSIDGISGAITVSAEFHVGHVRINPKKISWLPYSVPFAFRGGCDDSFITTPEQFFQQNATGRPSFFAVPVSVSLTKQTYPISCIGDGSYKAPDIENTATKDRKYPSSGWIKWLLGENRVRDTNIKIKSRTSYYQSVNVSFICHLGCVRYPNRKGDFPYVKPGTGPKQYVEMNIGNAYLAWNGQGAFPKLTNSFKEY